MVVHDNTGDRGIGDDGGERTVSGEVRRMDSIEAALAQLEVMHEEELETFLAR